MSSLADDLRNAQSKQPSRPNAPRGASGKSVSNALALHQQFEGMAQGLATQSDQRLESLGGALIAHRQQQVQRFADLVEQIQNGAVDMVLLGEELAARAEKRTMADAVFTVETKGVEIRDFTVKPDLMRSLTGQAFLKALEEA